MRLLLGLCALTAAPVVHAQVLPTAPQKPTKSMVAAAERYFRDGVQFTEEGNYSAARAAFEAGYSLSLEPDFLHNLSWTAEREGKIGEAIAYAERYLAAKPDADNAERTRRRIALLRSRLPAEPATVAPKPAPVPTQAPQIATSGPQSPDKPASRTGLPPGAIGLLVGGGALTLAGIGCLAGAWAVSGQAQAPGVTFDEWAQLGERGRSLNTAGLTLAIIGGAVVVGGGLWAIVGRTKTRGEDAQRTSGLLLGKSYPSQAALE